MLRVQEGGSLCWGHSVTLLLCVRSTGNIGGHTWAGPWGIPQPHSCLEAIRAVCIINPSCPKIAGITKNGLKTS